MPLSCGTSLPGAATSGNTSLNFTPNNGTFIYCNNPEQLFTTDLGDHAEGYGNKYLLWSLVSGKCRAYYEHENNTGQTIGYGVQLTNPGTSPVTVTVTNVGFGNDAFTCWTQFFTGTSSGGGTVGTFTLPPGGSLWIQRNDNAIPADAIFNGVIQFNVAGGRVYTYIYAYADFSKIDGTAAYIGEVTRTDPSGQDESLVYKGTSNGFILQHSRVTNISALRTNKPAWRTNGCSHTWPDETSNDMRSFTCPLTGPSSPTYATFNCANGSNLGNWGLQYHYRLTVTNDTTLLQKVHLVVAQPNGYSNVFVVVPSGRAGCLISNTNWNFYSYFIQPNATRTIHYHVILSGSSYGGLVNSIVVD